MPKMNFESAIVSESFIPMRRKGKSEGNERKFKNRFTEERKVKRVTIQEVDY